MLGSEEKRKPCITVEEYLALHWSEVTARPEPPKPVGKWEAMFDAVANEGGFFVPFALFASVAVVVLSSLRTIQGALILEGAGTLATIFAYSAPVALEATVFVVQGINTARKRTRSFGALTLNGATLISGLLILTLAVVSLHGSVADTWGDVAWSKVYAAVFLIQVLGLIILSGISGHIFAVGMNIMGYAFRAHKHRTVQALAEYNKAIADWRKRGIASYEAKLANGTLPCYLVERGEGDDSERADDGSHVNVTQAVREYLAQTGISPDEAKASEIAEALGLRGKTGTIRQALHRMRK